MISRDKIEIYVADSESSAVRAINMKTLKGVRCVVGGDKKPKNLHAYGDVDGVGTTARLQHPLGVHFVKNKNVVLVADTYNHKIKVVDPFTNEVFSWLGGGPGDFTDGLTEQSNFNEPTGLASLYEGDQVKIFIADCNNHCIRYCDYDDGEVHTIELIGVPPSTASKT